MIDLVLVDPHFLFLPSQITLAALDEFAARLTGASGVMSDSQNIFLPLRVLAELQQGQVLPTFQQLSDAIRATNADHLAPDVLWQQINQIQARYLDCADVTGVPFSVYDNDHWSPAVLVDRLPVDIRNAFCEVLVSLGYACQTLITENKFKILPCYTNDIEPAIDCTVNVTVHDVEGTNAVNGSFPVSITHVFPFDLAYLAPFPYTSVREVVDRAAERLTDLIFLDSSFTSADESLYENFARLARALNVMASVCKTRKKAVGSGIPLGRSLESVFLDREVVYSPHESEATRAQYSDEYTIQYKDGERWIDQHIKLGNSFDERRCLRIYFWIDDETGDFVIAHIGKHKRNVTNG